VNLLEALITLCIISMIAAVALPSWHLFYNRENDTALQLQLLRTLQFARWESQARHVQVGVCQSKDHQTCSGNWADGLLVFIDDSDDGLVHDASKILSVVQENAENGTLYLRSYPSYLSYLQFLPEGLMRSRNNGTFWYCHENTDQPAWAVTFNQAGETRVLYADKYGVIKDSEGKPLTC